MNWGASRYFDRYVGTSLRSEVLCLRYIEEIHGYKSMIILKLIANDLGYSPFMFF